MTGTTTLASALPDGTNPYWLEQLGPVTGLEYADESPGGPSTATCMIQADPSVRHAALRPGRRIQGFRGADVVWEGKLTDPVPGEDGWSLTVDGAGTWGTRFRALYPEGTAVTNWTPSYVVGAAITRGLEWASGDFSAGAYTAEVRDPGAMNISEFMDLMTSPAGRVWRVTNRQRLAAPTGPATWTVDIKNWPTVPTRLLVATGPVARTLSGYVNELYARYMVTADSGGTPATYGQAHQTGVADSVHGVYEAMWDQTNAGVQTLGAVNSSLTAALGKFTAATWGGPFKVRYGEYLTMGGAPVDLGCEKAYEVAQLIMTSGPYGGEVTVAPPIRFPVAKVKYAQDDDSLEVTPAQWWTDDWASILQMLAPKAPA